MKIEVNKEFLEEIVKDIAELCDSSFHVCPHEQWQSRGEPECREDGSPYLKGDDGIQCTCEEFDAVRDKITHVIEANPKEEDLTEKQILDHLKKTYPKSDYTDEDLTKDEYYNDVFFEMVDDVRDKFLNEKQYDSANDIVEEYMDKNNF